jgi:hypothetical protein
MDKIMEIEVITHTEKVIVTKETVSIELPTESKFYKMQDDGAWFARGTVLFAIIVKHKTTFMLYEIEEGKQFYTDFVPTKDCRQDYWLTDSNSIRRTAFDIMYGKNTEYTEMTKEEFLSKRSELLDSRMLELLNK